MGGLPYHSLAPDGEVEDYLISGTRVPVELSMFSAAYLEGAVELAWMTHSESENLGFHVLRSTDGGSRYERISELIPGAGNSTTVRAYRFADAAVQPTAIYHYMLADVSFQGDIVTHGPVTVHVPAALKPTLRLESPRPNPVQEVASVRYTIPHAGRIRLTLYDLAGRERTVLAQGNSPAGVYAAHVERVDNHGARLSAGSYLLVLTTETGTTSQRVVFVD